MCLIFSSRGMTDASGSMNEVKMPKATVIITVDNGHDRKIGKDWFEKNKKKLEFKSENDGCGCCVDIYYIKASPEIVDTIPEGIRATSTWDKSPPDQPWQRCPIGLVAIDSEKKTVSFNNVAAMTLGLDPDDANKKAPGDILPKIFTNLLSDSEIEKGVVETESECAINADRTAWLEINATRLADEKGVSLGYIFLFKDTRFRQ